MQGEYQARAPVTTQQQGAARAPRAPVTTQQGAARAPRAPATTQQGAAKAPHGSPDTPSLSKFASLKRCVGRTLKQLCDLFITCPGIFRNLELKITRKHQHQSVSDNFHHEHFAFYSRVWYLGAVNYSRPSIIQTSIIRTLDYPGHQNSVIHGCSCTLNRTVSFINTNYYFTYPGWHFQDFVRSGRDNGRSTVTIVVGTGGRVEGFEGWSFYPPPPPHMKP